MGRTSGEAPVPKLGGGGGRIGSSAPKVLFAGGKVQPGTKAFEKSQSRARIKSYEKKLKFEAIHRNTGMWNNGVRSL